MTPDEVHDKLNQAFASAERRLLYSLVQQDTEQRLDTLATLDGLKAAQRELRISLEEE